MLTYHPDAQNEFQAILAAAGRDVAMTLGAFIARNLQIETGAQPLATPQEFIGPGRRHSALFLVDFKAGLAQLAVVYEAFHPGLPHVLALDARNGLAAVAPAAGGDAKQRGHARSR